MTASDAVNEALVRIGTLVLALNNASDHGEIETLGAKLDAEMDRLDIADRVLAPLVENLLSGRPYLVDTDNGGTVARVHSLAAHLGATVTEQESLWVVGRRALRLDPATRQ